VLPLASERLAGIVGLIDARGLETDGLEPGLRELGAIFALFERAGHASDPELDALPDGCRDLAADDTPMLPVLRHAVDALARGGLKADVVVLLQPTSPFRRAEHIDAAVDLLAATGADSVVSVVEVPHQFNPVSVLALADGRLQPYAPGPLVTRRQDKPRVYARNGPAVLAVRVAVLEQGQLYGGDCRALVMTAAESVDIDDQHDFEYAEFLLNRIRN